ncbi:E3 ubiquitin-protein ligase DZIP3-like [Mercenaria mercenaria]|uniref:E3 ubiquitin-protein ligase DZIP3-like n=1 Tax=Mercenaria mercenaria TaxID=6596 RepID=UPI00234EEA2A|nr:E3 ubiquitin-protein ligase DZIP3-like [Mercenaria mercenaria]
MSDSTESSAYFYRIITLVVGVGTVTLRDLFYSICPKADVVTLFASSQISSEFTRLKSKKILTGVQYQHVTVNPDPDTYDISLLITLLTNKEICGITKPANGWGQFPPDTDLSLGADLLRARDIRNEIVGHPPNAQIEQKEFQGLWGKIETVLVRIASHVGSTEEAKIKQMIEEAKTRVLEPLNDREEKLLQVFLERQKEDSEQYQAQLTGLQKSLADLHLKVDATDASRSDDKLTLLQSQVESIAKNIGNMAQQGAVQEVNMSSGVFVALCKIFS